MGTSLTRAKAAIEDLKDEIQLFEKFKQDNPPEENPRIDLAESYEEMLTDIMQSVQSLGLIFEAVDKEYRGAVSKMLYDEIRAFPKDFFEFEHSYNNGFLENFIKDCDKMLNTRTLRG